MQNSSTHDTLKTTIETAESKVIIIVRTDIQLQFSKLDYQDDCVQSIVNIFTELEKTGTGKTQQPTTNLSQKIL